MSTYDEMNMCKARLRAIDLEEFEQNKDKKSKFDIFTHEVEFIFTINSWFFLY